MYTSGVFRKTIGKTKTASYNNVEAKMVVMTAPWTPTLRNFCFWVLSWMPTMVLPLSYLLFRPVMVLTTNNLKTIVS